MARKELDELEEREPGEKIAHITRHHTMLLETIIRNKELSSLEKTKKLCHSSGNFLQCLENLLKIRELKDGH